MAASQAQVERARVILLAAAIAYDRGEIDNPISYVMPHFDGLAFLLSATRDEAEVMVRADRFSRVEKRQLEGTAYLVYLDLLMDFAEVGDSETLLRQAFWMKTLVAYNSTIKDLVAKRRWEQCEALCGKYLEDARRTSSPICLLRPLVRMAHVKLMTGQLEACVRLLDEFDSLREVALSGPGADLVPGGAGTEWTAGMAHEADELRRHLQEQQRRQQW